MAQPKLSLDRLEFLAELPTLLNSSLRTGQVIEGALKFLRSKLEAEAATVFLLQGSGKELTFWALQGGDASGLIGKRMPSDQGLVGWVIQKREALLVNDVESDPRFFSEVDKETEFKTKSVICVPLIARGKRLIGALQVINRKDGGSFTEEDLYFTEKLSHQAALAIFNAKLYKEAQASNRQLAELNRKKDDMISVITHEFKTPINILQNSIELLTVDSLAEAQRKVIASTLLSGLSRLTTVVSRVRDVSSVTQGKLSPQLAPFAAGEIVQLIISEFEEVFARRNLNFSSDIGEKGPLVEADLTLIMVAMRNLISNAIRFTPDHGSIAISAFQTVGLVEFAVTDTGIGIEESQQKAIFERFYEVADALSHGSGSYEFKSCGLGLGLPTAKAILEAHGTDLIVKSKLDQGSRFSFRLKPAAKT